MAPPPPAAASPWDVAARAFAAWRGGDAAAFDDLVRALTSTLWHVARAYGLSREAAEDVVQSSWLALVRSADSVSDPQAVGGWLVTTTRRAAWREVARSPRPVPGTQEALERRPDRADVEGEALAGLDAGAVWDAVAALTARCQRLLRVVAFDERPDYARLAADLGMPIGSIGPTRRRCLDKLRASLAAGLS